MGTRANVRVDIRTMARGSGDCIPGTEVTILKVLIRRSCLWLVLLRPSCMCMHLRGVIFFLFDLIYQPPSFHGQFSRYLPMRRIFSFWQYTIR